MTDPDTPRLLGPDGRAIPREEEVVDAEIVDETAPPAGALAVREDAPPAASASSTALFNARDPEDLIAQATAVATALDRVLKAQNLTTNVGGTKRHVDVEGWQTLGTLLGCVAELDHARPWVDPETGKPDRVTYTARVEHYEGRGNQRRLARITTYDVDGYSWEARVRIIRNGIVVGVGEALCSRKEQRWGRAEDYAVKSMAITRATSRAYKQAAGWVVALAGYSATPSAEVDPMTNTVLPYGPDADGKTIEHMRKAASFLLDGDDPASDPEEVYDAVQDWITKVHGAAGGHLPAVVASAVRLLATARKTLAATPDQQEQPTR